MPTSSMLIPKSERPMWRAIVGAKAILGLAVAIGFFCEFNTPQSMSVLARWRHFNESSLARHLATWDGSHYLILSEAGYEKGSPSCAFYPLWPATIRLVRYLVGGDSLLLALLLANGFSLIAYSMFYVLVSRDFGGAIARDSLILVVAFPGALFFSLPYTEWIYFLMVVFFFTALEREHIFWPCAAAFLMPLTRPIGVFVILPWAWHMYEGKKPWRHWLPLLAPLLGYAAYFILIYAWTGNALEGFEAQKNYPNAPSIQNITNLSGFLHAFVSINSFGGMRDAILDRSCFILVLALLPFIFRIKKTWFFYTFVVGLVPATTSWFMSYRRYIMVCFPVFVVLALLLSKTRTRWLFWYYVALLWSVQLWAATEFTNFNWAG